MLGMAINVVSIKIDQICTKDERFILVHEHVPQVIDPSLRD